MKNLQDIKKEYGYILRWVNAEVVNGVEHKGFYFLESVKDYHERIMIDNQEALDYIMEVTNNAFRGYDQYKHYVKLFSILGVETNGKI